MMLRLLNWLRWRRADIPLPPISIYRYISNPLILLELGFEIYRLYTAGWSTTKAVGGFSLAAFYLFVKCIKLVGGTSQLF